MLAEWLSCSFHITLGRGLWLLLGKEVAGSATPSSTPLGLGSTDHSSFTSRERDGAERPVHEEHFNIRCRTAGRHVNWTQAMGALHSTHSPPGHRPATSPLPQANRKPQAMELSQLQDHSPCSTTQGSPVGDSRQCRTHAWSSSPALPHRGHQVGCGHSYCGSGTETALPLHRHK